MKTLLIVIVGLVLGSIMMTFDNNSTVETIDELANDWSLETGL